MAKYFKTPSKTATYADDGVLYFILHTTAIQ